MPEGPPPSAATSPYFDVAVVGGGIVGLATAMALVCPAPWGRRPAASRRSLVVLEAEAQLAAHQTGHNSGVIHSGLYYKPGSLKARTCTEGRDALYQLCAEENVPHERCGKVVVATEAEEIPRLDELERRGRANGLHDLRRLSVDELRELEPHARGIDGLHVPITGIVDYVAVAAAYARKVSAEGGEVRTGSREK